MRPQKKNAYPDQAPMRRVIIADPDAGARMLYCESFRADGWEIVEASEGRDALVQALVWKASLLITELRLPLVDGYALCQVLRRDAATRFLPILVVTTETRATE